MNAMKLALLGVAGYFIYEKFFATPATAAATTPASSGTSTTASNPTAAGGTSTGAAVDPYTAYCAQNPTGTFTDGRACPGVQTVAQKMVAANGGADSAGLDVWSYFWQSVTGKTITADQMVAIIAAAGGDRTKAVTAAAFVAFLPSAGLAGYPRGRRVASGVPRGAINYVPKAAGPGYSLANFGARRVASDGALY